MVFNNEPHTHALIDLPTRYSIEDVIKLFKDLHRIGLITIESLKADLPGVVTTEPSPFHTLMLDVSRYTIVASGRSEEYEMFVKRYGPGMAVRGKPLKWFCQP